MAHDKRFVFHKRKCYSYLCMECNNRHLHVYCYLVEGRSLKKLIYSKESMQMLQACMRHFQRQWAWRQEENQSESIDHCVDNSATDVINAVKLSRNKMEKSPAKAEKSYDKYEYDPNHSDGKKLLKIRSGKSFILT